MATNDTAGDEQTERDRCRVVTEVALRKAAEKCGGEEAMKEQLRMMLGFTDDEPDPDCGQALAEGINEETVATPRGVNQWVFCFAWQQYKQDEADNLGEALEQAWAEAKARAEEQGLTI